MMNVKDGHRKKNILFKLLRGSRELAARYKSVISNIDFQTNPYLDHFSRILFDKVIAFLKKRCYKTFSCKLSITQK